MKDGGLMEFSNKKLYETAIWKTYMGKNPATERREWVEKVYANSVNWLTHTSVIFPNYTLHDETHIINVLKAMAGLLGNACEKLSMCECELLILAAALHDIGMVYDEQGINNAAANSSRCQSFLQAHAPEYLGLPFADWPEAIQQNYLRDCHPFRLPELLADPTWGMQNRPRGVVPKEVIIAVCQAHGEDEAYLKNESQLAYKCAPFDADPRFCALLLRLGDILDFDDSRAPEILLSFTQGNPISEEEFRKHQASGGFSYPDEPTQQELPYFAECTVPEIEYRLRRYLDWVDQELFLSNRVKQLCKKDWQRQFPFPTAVSRSQIISDGYDSGDFHLTMDQAQILQLLTGENLYSANDVFVRELLQNSIDATLLREKMERDFDAESEKAAIYLWEWTDNAGRIFFRIDDHGTGMTRGMLRQYFLKVGNSYYNSDELQRDLLNCKYYEKFHSISRFGIGFLSCFLCGTSAEISTLYFDKTKNQRESSFYSSGHRDYGLRMEITGLKGHYALRNQAQGHIPTEPLPRPMGFDAQLQGLEASGYRALPGTSICVTLNPGALGAIDLRHSVTQYLCGAKMPVYYNGQRIGKTHREMMDEAHRLAGEHIWELTDKQKQTYDEAFPFAKGQYPKIAVTVTPLDSAEYQMHPDFSGIAVQYRAFFENSPAWEIYDQKYFLHLDVHTHYVDGICVPTLRVESRNMKSISASYYGSWSRIVRDYPEADVSALKNAFDRYTQCPASAQALGDAWLPFAEKEDLDSLWRQYVDCFIQHEDMMRIPLDNIPSLSQITGNSRCAFNVCSYHSILGGTLCASNTDILFDFKDSFRPAMDIGRGRVAEIPPEALLAVEGTLMLLEKEPDKYLNLETAGLSTLALKSFREIRKLPHNKWLTDSFSGQAEHILAELAVPVSRSADFSICASPNGGAADLALFFMAALQDDYDLQICYEAGQVVTLEKKIASDPDTRYDLLPPMLFCASASEESRKYLCAEEWTVRRGINADHPFSKWLLQNAAVLKSRFPRQLEQIVFCLREEEAAAIISTMNGIRDQLSRLPGTEALHLADLAPLTENDFWNAEAYVRQTTPEALCVD